MSERKRLYDVLGGMGRATRAFIDAQEILRNPRLWTPERIRLATGALKKDREFLTDEQLDIAISVNNALAQLIGEVA